MSSTVSTDAITISNRTEAGETLEATFMPSVGMNMLSYKKNGVEVIDQSTRSMFEERSAGLGPLIGPHFHRRLDSVLHKVEKPELFPHIARVKANGVNEPFSHGIARYAPWQAESTLTGFKAKLDSSHEWNGVALKDLQGQDFRMNFDAEMLPTGLQLTLSVISDFESLVGIHYYYRLPNGKGQVISDVLPDYRSNGELLPLKEAWCPEKPRAIACSLDEEYDFGFRPYPSPSNGDIRLETDEYKLTTTYQCANAENSWQLYHPANSSFVCIEPMSAMNPRKPRLTVSGLEIHLGIELP